MANKAIDKAYLLQTLKDFDSKILSSELKTKFDATYLNTKTIFVDYVSGDDTKDGSTTSNAVKTVNRALELAPISRSLVIKLCSNYTGDINISGYDILNIRSSGLNTKRTISGNINISNCCALTLQDLTVNTDISPYTDFIMACADLSAITGLYINNCDFVAKNTDADGGYCLNISSIENARIRKTTLSVDPLSTYNVDASIYNSGSLINIPYASGQTNTASGANYVIQIVSFGQCYLAQGFLTNSTCINTNKIDNAGGIVYIDGKLQSNHLPIASSDSLGAIKVGRNLSIDPVTGILSATGGGSGGNTILPTPGNTSTEATIVDVINDAENTSEDVASLYGIQNWSNSMTKRIIYTGSIAAGDTGIGYWPTVSEYETLEEMTAQERAAIEGASIENNGYGWWYNDAFKNPNVAWTGTGNDLSNDDAVDIDIKYDPLAGGEVLTLGGYIIDTDTGYACIKFAKAAATATHSICVDLNILRNSY